MNTITFNRYASKLQRAMISEIEDVKKIIENTFTDLDINPYITQTEAVSELVRIGKTYENFYGITTMFLLREIVEILEDEAQDIDDVVWSLATAFLFLDELIFTICTPVLSMNETALANIAELAENGFDSLNHLDCVVYDDTEEDETENG